MRLPVSPFCACTYPFFLEILQELKWSRNSTDENRTSEPRPLEWTLSLRTATPLYKGIQQSYIKNGPSKPSIKLSSPLGWTTARSGDSPQKQGLAHVSSVGVSCGLPWTPLWGGSWELSWGVLEGLKTERSHPRGRCRGRSRGHTRGSTRGVEVRFRLLCASSIKIFPE